MVLAAVCRQFRSVYLKTFSANTTATLVNAVEWGISASQLLFLEELEYTARARAGNQTMTFECSKVVDRIRWSGDCIHLCICCHEWPLGNATMDAKTRLLVELMYVCMC